MKLLVILLLSTLGLSAQDAPQQIAPLGDFKLQSGETIRDCRIGYRTLGRLNEPKSNAILFPTWFTGSSADLVRTVRDSGLIDTSRFFVIFVDALGNGVSSAPSNSTKQPRLQFPRFTIRDMVESEHRLVSDVLKISHLHAVMGISMGGMQTFEWAVAYPGFMDKAIPIVGSPRLTSYDLLLWEAEKHVIEEDAVWNKGNYDSPPPLKALADIHDLNLTTPQYRAEHTPPNQFESYIAGVEKNGPARFDANNWLRQLEAMIGHDVSRGFDGSMERAAKSVKARMLVIVATQDHMVNPAPAVEFARLLKDAPVVELTGPCGHIATGCEAAKMAGAVKRHLQQ